MNLNRLTNDHRCALRDAAFTAGDAVSKLTDLVVDLVEADLHREAAQLRALRDAIDNAPNLHDLWRQL